MSQTHLLAPANLNLELPGHVLALLLVLLHLLLGLAHLLLEHVKNVAALHRVRHDVRHVAAGRGREETQRDHNGVSILPSGVDEGRHKHSTC